MSDLLRWEVEKVAGDVVMRVKGELDISNVEEFAADALKAMGTGESCVLDLAGVSYLDSVGIHALFRIAGHATKGGCRLEMRVPPDSPIRRVLKLTRLDNAIPLSPGPGD